MPFIPTTTEEISGRGWSELDVIFISGDAYIDHPAFGVPLLARWLEKHGFRVGIIAQPDWRSKDAFMALGRPRLCFAVSAGAMDSMVAHYTPARKLRHDDAYTPGNRHGARPNRATIIYTSRLKEAYRDVPVIIGGIEASLRRFAHYDFWEDKVRRSILFDAKADLLIYGMAERPLLEVVGRLHAGEQVQDIRTVRGTCRIAAKDERAALVSASPGSDREGAREDLLEIPSYEDVTADKLRFAEAFRLASNEQNPCSSRAIVQRHAERLLISAPPALPLSEAEMDAIYALPFEKAPHPSYQEQIPAWEQIKLPPFNGFVSEWLLLQAFLLSPGLPNSYINMLIPVAAAVIALAAALAAYVMVKFYGVIFLGQPRGEARAQPHDAGIWERIGLGWLALGCVVLGLAPVFVVRQLDLVTQVLVGRGLGNAAAGWLFLAPVDTERASYSPVYFLLAVLGVMLVTALVVRHYYHGRLRRGPAWDCGFPAQTSRMQDTAEGFGQPIRRIFEPFFRIERELPSPFDTHPRYHGRSEDRLWYALYLPIKHITEKLSSWASLLQHGRIHLYLTYTFVTLVVLLAFV